MQYFHSSNCAWFTQIEVVQWKIFMTVRLKYVSVLVLIPAVEDE